MCLLETTTVCSSWPRPCRGGHGLPEVPYRSARLTAGLLIRSCVLLILSGKPFLPDPSGSGQVGGCSCGRADSRGAVQHGGCPGSSARHTGQIIGRSGRSVVSGTPSRRWSRRLL